MNELDLLIEEIKTVIQPLEFVKNIVISKRPLHLVAVCDILTDEEVDELNSHLDTKLGVVVDRKANLTNPGTLLIKHTHTGETVANNCTIMLLSYPLA